MENEEAIENDVIDTQSDNSDVGSVQEPDNSDNSDENQTQEPDKNESEAENKSQFATKYPF